MMKFQRMPDPFGAKGGNLFEYWVSFWPVAPYFGVAWRFAPLFEPMAGFANIAERQMDSALSAAGDQFDKAMKKSQKAVETAAAAVVEETSAALAGVVELASQVGDVPVAPKPPRKAPKAKAPAEPVAAPFEDLDEGLPPVETAVEVAVEVAPEPAPAADGRPAALLGAAPAHADDLKLIKGIGPKLEAELNGLGVWTFAQMAAFSEADLMWIDEHLSAFKGRCFRDDWTGQAKALLG